MLNRHLLYGLFLACCHLGAAAQSRDFLPEKTDSVLLAGLSAKYQEEYKRELTQLPGVNKKDFQELYGERWKSIKARFDAQEIYTSAAAQQYLDALAGEIVKANAVLQDHPFRCYFSRSYIPNAEYVGEGIILVNMGLFQRLHNESEAVFILCHEIAHYILRHQENSMDKYVAMINSEETQAALRKIKNTEYRKKEQLESLVKGLSFDSRRHSRDHEAQADSMGLELMRHTSFDPSGALTTLALLDGIDKDDFDTDAFLQETFNAKEYPFQKKWLHRETGLLGGFAQVQEEEMSDSLKTHPSCKLRIQLLTPMVGAGKTPGAPSGTAAAAHGYGVDPKKFAVLQELFRYEVIEYAYVSSDYTESLFLSLELLQARPADGYLVANVGRLLNGLYQAQRDHRLGKVVDLPSPGYPTNYNVLLQFVQNLHLEDLAAISYYFLSAWYPQLDNSIVFKSAYAESIRLVKQ